MAVKVGVLPDGAVLTSKWRRLAGFWLELLLFFVTLGIGWLIWSVVLWSRAQTPAKQVLGMRVLDTGSGRTFTWAQMLLREIIVKRVIIGLIAGVTGGLAFLVGAALIYTGKLNKTLWDRMVNSTVVNDRAGSLR